MPSNTTYCPQTWNDVQANNVKTAAHGATANCPANESINIDLVLTDDVLVRGIEFLAAGQIFGDTITLQVIDTNGITGAPAGTVLATPVSNWNIPALNQNVVLTYTAVCPLKLKATLTIRAIYTSTGLPVDVSINYLLLNVLV